MNLLLNGQLLEMFPSFSTMQWGRETSSSPPPQRFVVMALQFFQVADHQLLSEASTSSLGSGKVKRNMVHQCTRCAGNCLSLKPAPPVLCNKGIILNMTSFFQFCNFSLFVSKHFLRHFHLFAPGFTRTKHTDSSTPTRTRGLIVRLLLFSFHSASCRWPLQHRELCVKPVALPAGKNKTKWKQQLCNLFLQLLTVHTGWCRWYQDGHPGLN